MKSKTFILGTLLLFGCSVFAQDADKKQAAGKEPSKEEKAWMTYMTPNQMHDMLAKQNGEWSESLTFWEKPGAPPQKAEAKCNNTMVLGNRYQESNHTGMMMGMPFEGKSTVGYDNAKKVFQSTWVDNMGTGITYMEGTYNEKTKTMSMAGKMVDPMSGKEEKAREVIKFVDDNNQVMEMYVTKDGKEFKNMEIKFTRK